MVMKLKVTIQWHQKARILLQQQDKTYRDLADALDLTTGAVGHYMCGRRQPKPEMLKKIATFLGVSVSELIEDDPIFARDENEYKVLDKFRLLSDHDKLAALAMIDGLASQSVTPPTNRLISQERVA